jgi:hypothetical protein
MHYSIYSFSLLTALPKLLRHALSEIVISSNTIASVNWPTVIAITLFSSTVVVGSWFLIQRFVPIQLDPNSAQKIDTLYNQYLNQRQTKTSGAKKR